VQSPNWPRPPVCFLKRAADVLGLLGDGFAVGDAGLADLDVDLHVADEFGADDVEVELAHAGDDGLAGLVVELGAEAGVLAPDDAQGLGEAALVLAGLGLDGHGDDGLGEEHALEEDGLVGVAEGVAGVGVLDADDGDDVAGAGGLEGDAVVGVHLEDAGGVFLLAVARLRRRVPLVRVPE